MIFRKSLVSLVHDWTLRYGARSNMFVLVLHTLNPLAQTCREPHDFNIAAMAAIFVCLRQTSMKWVLCL